MTVKKNDVPLCSFFQVDDKLSLKYYYLIQYSGSHAFKLKNSAGEDDVFLIKIGKTEMSAETFKSNVKAQKCIKFVGHLDISSLDPLFEAIINKTFNGAPYVKKDFWNEIENNFKDPNDWVLVTRSYGSLLEFKGNFESSMCIPDEKGYVEVSKKGTPMHYLKKRTKEGEFGLDYSFCIAFAGKKAKWYKTPNEKKGENVFLWFYQVGTASSKKEVQEMQENLCDIIRCSDLKQYFKLTQHRPYLITLPLNTAQENVLTTIKRSVKTENWKYVDSMRPGIEKFLSCSWKIALPDEFALLQTMEDDKKRDDKLQKVAKKGRFTVHCAYKSCNLSFSQDFSS